MVGKKSAIAADDAHAHQAALEVVLDDVGPAIIVDGERKATTAADLEVLGRRALAIAAALQGSLRPAEPVDVEPFRPIWPARLPVESGVPVELVTEHQLSGCQRFVWQALWLLVPHLTGRLVVRARISWVAQWLGLDQNTVRRALQRFDELGWATVLWRATPPSGYGEFEALLHLQRRVDAPEAGVIDASAEPK